MTPSSLTRFRRNSQLLSALAFEDDSPFRTPVLLSPKKDRLFSALVALEDYAIRLKFPTTPHTSPPSRSFQGPSKKVGLNEEPNPCAYESLSQEGILLVPTKSIVVSPIASLPRG
jgi:hypothetical protein